MLDNLFSFARKGWWSQSNGIGTVQTVQVPLSAGQMNLCGEDYLGPPMPQTITLSRQDDRYLDPPDQLTMNWDWRALIAVGAGAGTRYITCDWMHGTQINVAGSGQVRIAALAYAPRPGIPYRATDDVGAVRASSILGASMGVSGSGHLPPRYTQRLPDLVGGAIPQPAIPIHPPHWADAVQVCLAETVESQNPYDTDHALIWVGPDGREICRATGDTFQSGWKVIPSGARLQLVNGTLDLMRVTLIWRLSL